MSIFTRLAQSVFGGWNADGSPRQIDPQETAIWGTEVERLLSAAATGPTKIYGSLAQMNADLTPAANTPAIVLGDGANDGYYQKIGATGAGSWVFRGRLPYSFIRAINAGAGTPNAILAMAITPVPAADGAALVTFNVTAENTGPVTVSFDGAAALNILTSSGNPLVAGALKPGMVSGFKEGVNFRLLTDVASAAILAAAEAAANRAEAASALVSADKIKFKTVPVLEADTLMSYDAAPGKVQVGAGDRIEAAGFGFDVIASSETDNDNQTAAGVKVRVIRDQYLTLDAFGVKGDGTDETAKLKNAIEKMGGRKVTLYGDHNRNYVFSDKIEVDTLTLDFRDSLVTLQHVGQKDCFVVKNSGSILNATIDHDGSVGGGITGITQYPILGYDIKCSKFKGLKFTAPTINGRVAIACYGDVEGVELDDIEFLGSANWGMGIIFHWLCADGTVNASALNKTRHPRDLKIGNVKADELSNTGSLVSTVFLSGCYNAIVENAKTDTCRNLISVIAGDYANEFAVDRDLPFVGNGITIINPASRRVNGAAGIRVQGDGVLTTRRLRMGVKIINPTLRGESNTAFGVLAFRSSGVEVVGGKIWAFRFGMTFGSGCKGGRIAGTELHDNWQRGVSSDGSGEFNTNISIVGCKVHNNNIEDTTGVGNSGIYVRETKGCLISGQHFGLQGGPEKQFHSVYVDTTSDNIKLSDNHTYSSKSTVAYQANNANPYSMNLWGVNNTTDTTLLYGGHVFYEPVGYNKKRFVFDASAGFPVGGTWEQGDAFTYRNPVTSGFEGGIRVPGAWRNVGPIPA